MEVLAGRGRCTCLSNGGTKMANEKRMIDANAFWNLLQQVVYDVFTVHEHDGKLAGTASVGYYTETIQEVLKQTPTVDAVEVVHGRWIEKMDMVASYLAGCEETFFECSVCNSTNYGETPYCPNCGAKMDFE
jgi:uncharacterized paraquat-inducible protein A